MKIIGVSTMKDEADRVASVLAHLHHQGVDMVFVSTEINDLTFDAYMDAPLSPQRGWSKCYEPFRQDVEITRLAHMAAANNADWIIPFDADEYWCGQGGRTIRQVLEEVPQSVTVIYAGHYLHLDRTRRCEHPKPLNKIAVRPADDLSIHWGSHGTNRLGDTAHGILTVRELQYESFDHLLSKVDKTRTLFAQGHVDLSHGVHMQRLAAMTDDQLKAFWESHISQPTIEDPIPCP